MASNHSLRQYWGHTIPLRASLRNIRSRKTAIKKTSPPKSERLSLVRGPDAEPHFRFGEYKILECLFYLVIIPVFDALFTLNCLAQPINHNFDDTKRKNYVYERLLKIEITAYSKRDKKNVTSYGSGFLISPDGYALTAKHVIEPAISDDYQWQKIIIKKPTGLQSINLELAKDIDEKFLRSKLADVALFRVKSDGPEAFPYLCLDLTDSHQNMPNLATVASLHYYEKPYDDWVLAIEENVKIQGRGPGDLFQYWRLNYPFHNSMSGGAVLVGDQVVAIISLGLDKNGIPIEGENYANPLRFASDLGLRDRAASCRGDNGRRRDLRQLLAELIPNPNDAIRIATDAGLNRSNITIDKKPINTWFNILAGASDDQVNKIFDLALEELPGNARLLALRGDQTPHPFQSSLYELTDRKIDERIKEIGVVSETEVLTGARRQALSGKWVGRQRQPFGPEGSPIEYDVFLTIDWDGSTPKGSFRFKYAHENTNIDETVSVKGEFVYDRFLRLQYFDTTSGKIQFGMLLLELSEDGKTLVGTDLGFGYSTKRIMSADARFEKQRM